MIRDRVYKLSKLISVKLFFVLLAGFCCLPAAKASELDLGIASFNKHDYKTALQHFAAALNADPNNCSALYYEAVTFHRLNQMSLAKQAYAAVIMRYPNTEAARNAQAALNYLNPAYLKTFRQQVTVGGRNIAPAVPSAAASTANNESFRESDSNLASLPDQVSIPYRKEGNNLVVNAFINSHPVEMYFDSGAEVTVIQKSFCSSLGLRDPNGAPVGLTYGVGDGGAQKTWEVKTDIKVGQIEHKNFPVTVQDDASGGNSVPLLGETFFRGFSYSVVPAAADSRGLIVFKKKSLNSGIAHDSSSVPYKDLGTEMIVNVEVNGRTVPMIFDTGAETCCFTWHQWVDQMKMPVPDDAADSHNVGIAGTTRSKHFNVESMRLGSISKHDVPVDVIESSNIPYPLLGNTFFGDLHIEVDNTAHIIRLRR